MVALDLDNAILNGASAPTFGLESLREAAQGVLFHPKAIDQGDAFALAPLGLAPQSYYAIAWCRGTRLLALASRDGVLTGRANSAAVCRVHEGGIAWHSR